jgi:hypothetical protein
MEKPNSIELGGVYLLDLSPTHEWRIYAKEGYVGLWERYAVAHLLDRGEDPNGDELAIFLCRSIRSSYLVHSLECKFSDLRWERLPWDGGSRTVGVDVAIFSPGTRLHVPILPSYLHDIDVVETLYKEVYFRHVRDALGVPGGDPLIGALVQRPPSKRILDDLDIIHRNSLKSH